MSYNTNLPVDISTLTSEERRHIFIALLNTDPSLPNALNSEQRRCLYSVLIAIDSSLLPDARSAVHGIMNEQFPIGSTMNPIMLKTYEDYKEEHKRNKKEFQWHEFLKLDKNQYLNFRASNKSNDLRNRAASRFTRGEALSRQPKGSVGEVINDVANPTFPISETDFILHDWLTSYCNSMVDQIKKKKIVEAKNKGLPLPPKKKNIQPPSRLKRRTDNITVNEVIDDPENTSEANASTITSETNASTISNIPVITKDIVPDDDTSQNTRSRKRKQKTTEITPETPLRKSKRNRKVN
uniref:Uncharacterized protein n=1 Tax=Rhizophagus irregularis (strain DAOM 181602 / DAOM 197198 / MUCL 43194) TaxID=747089 RepID=U9TIH1_RHIID